MLQCNRQITVRDPGSYSGRGERCDDRCRGHTREDRCFPMVLVTFDFRKCKLFSFVSLKTGFVRDI